MAEEEKYIVTVDGAERELKVKSEGGIFSITDGNGDCTVSAEYLGGGKYLIRFGSATEEIRIAPNGGSLEVFVDGARHDVRVEPYSLAELRKKAGAASDAVQDKIIAAPMPGLVLSIEVQPGDEIKKDQTLLIIEAMKMENIIKAVSTGKVKAVHVEPGQAVEKGDRMVELE